MLLPQLNTPLNEPLRIGVVRIDRHVEQPIGTFTSNSDRRPCLGGVHVEREDWPAGDAVLRVRFRERIPDVTWNDPAGVL